MKIIHKIILIFLLVASIEVVTSLFTLQSYNEITKTFTSLVDDPTHTSEILNSLKQSGLRIASSTSEYGFVHDEAASPGDADRAEEEIQTIESSHRTFDASLRRYEDLVRTVVPDDAKTMENLKASGNKLIKTSSEIIELKKRNISGKEVLAKSVEFETNEKEFLKYVDDALEKESRDQMQAQRNLEASIAFATRRTLIIRILSFILAMSFGLYISFSISSRIGKLKEATLKVGSGELDTQIEMDSKDEIGDLSRSFNKMTGDLKASRANLASAKIFTDKVLDSMVDFVVVTDLEMTITKVNKSTLKITGYEEKELVGKLVNILMADKPFNKKGVNVLRKNGYAANLDKAVLNKDGTLTPVSMSLSVFKDDEGNDLGIVCVGKDISERKRAEAESGVISEILHGVTSTANLDELLQLIHRSIGQIVYAENCYVALYNAKTDLLSVPFCVDKYDTPAAPAKLGTGLTAYVLRTGKPVLLTADAIRELNEKGEIAIVGTKPAIWLGVPLRTPKGIIGVLVVQHYEDKGAYSVGDLKLLATVGDQIALAIERKRVEEALRISEEQHRLLFETNPQAAYVYDIETMAFLAVNEAAIQHYGYSREEFYNSITIKDIRPTEDIPRFLDKLSKVTSRRDTISVPSRHQKKDGTLADVEITSHALVFAGRPAEIALVNDVTDRRRMVNEAEVISEIIQGVASTANLDELLHLIHRSIGRILYAENCFVALHDRSTDQLNFEFWADKFDPIPAPSSVGKSFSNYVLRTGNALLLTKERESELFASGLVERVGSESASWLGVPLMTPERTIGVLVVQHYDNEGAYGQQDLAFLVSVGDQIAMAIERKRAEEQLTIFNEKLQQSNRELQDFAYVASHDLQEPLRKVQAFSDRLKTKYARKLEGDGIDYLERIRNAANRMQLLIQDLLTFSRVSTQARPFSSVDLNAITKEVLSDLEVKIEETGATIEIRDLPVVDADPMQMRQLIQNLVGNALKFRQNDTPPVISIYSQKVKSNGNGFGKCREIVVKDNGIGFDEKYTDKIFAVFQRLHGRGEYEGSGVGLAICRKIVERHNGKISAQSTLGEGATFAFTIPLKQNDPQVI